VLEDEQRLRLTDLIELGCLRENDLGDLDALRCVYREHRRDERRIARSVRLNVKPIWNSNLQSGANRSPWSRI
jgi:hypothetical protein